MKTILCYTALLMGVAVQPALAQIVWTTGEATLSTGITVRGDLCYQPEMNALMVRVADKCRVYPAGHLQHIEFADLTTGCRRYFTVLDVPQPGQQEAVPLIFEELVPGATVRVLQLAGSNARLIARQYGLPKTHKSQWQTPQPWYVWVNGRFVAPDDFVDNELDNMLLNSPEPVQQWAKAKWRPTTPKLLATWLACYYGKMHAAKAYAEPTLMTGHYTNL